MEKTLTALAVMQATTAKSEERILKAAIEQQDNVRKKLKAYREGALTGAEGAGETYMHLIEEFGRLDRVILIAKKRLHKS